MSKLKQFIIIRYFSINITVSNVFWLLTIFTNQSSMFDKVINTLLKENTFLIVIKQSQVNYDKYFPSLENLNFKKNVMAPFYGWGSTVSRLQSHYEETVYFLPISLSYFAVYFRNLQASLLLTRKCFSFAKGHFYKMNILNALNANPTKWSNTLKQFVGFCR